MEARHLRNIHDGMEERLGKRGYKPGERAPRDVVEEAFRDLGLRRIVPRAGAQRVRRLRAPGRRRRRRDGRCRADPRRPRRRHLDVQIKARRGGDDERAATRCTGRALRGPVRRLRRARARGIRRRRRRVRFQALLTSTRASNDETPPSARRAKASRSTCARAASSRARWRSYRGTFASRSSATSWRGTSLDLKTFEEIFRRYLRRHCQRLCA